ncbi:MAG: adenylosuccinate synthase [Planctomycetota bacterium]
MPTTCVIGLLWGDEGKGKIIDLFAQDADFVVRFGGGHNAGHTLIRDGQKLVLHLVPSAILRPSVVNVIGNGVVVDPAYLRQEIDELKETGVDVRLGENLLVSEGAHVVLPVHQALDRVAEKMRGADKIGTTGRGIGPAYADRASRSGLRMGDLIRPKRLRAALARTVTEKNALLRAFDEEVIDAAALEGQLLELGEALRPAICDAGHALREAVREGKRVLCEGAQGVLLDVDHGTYPFVTSSSASSGGIAVGTGLSPKSLDRVVGVVKAYATRVGEGPFPSELHGEIAETLRAAGGEYGATTGRPRRIGDFDAVAVRYAAAVSGVDELVVTNLDVLSGFEPLRIVTGHRRGDEVLDRFSACDLDDLECVVEELPGFTENVREIRRFQDLPVNAQRYIERIEELTGVPVATISVGPGRDEVLHRAVEAGVR